MKTYVITMKDGTRYSHQQSDGWAEHIANCMADSGYGESVIAADDKSWVASVSEIAHIHTEQQQEGVAA